MNLTEAFAHWQTLLGAESILDVAQTQIPLWSRHYWR